MKKHTDIILKTEDLCKYYGTGDNQVKAVDHVNIEIRQGEFVSIVGKSGSGKSTLLHMLGGLDNPSSGKVFIDGENIASFKEEKLSKIRRRKIGFIFQAYNLIPSLNVWENIVLPLGLDGKPVDKDAGPFRKSKKSAKHPIGRSAAKMRHRQSHCCKAFHHSCRRAHRQSGHPYRR